MPAASASSDSSPPQGHAAFDVHCAPCHGVTGTGGGYLTASTQTPDIAGAPVGDVLRLVRDGRREMPAFSEHVLSDANLRDLATYVHETLGHPPREPALLGPRTLDPFAVGVVAWVALVVFVCALALLFSEGRH